MIYFLIYLFVEIYVSVKIASAIGPFWTFVEIVGTAVYGMWLLQNMHIQMAATMQALMNGHISVEEFERMNLYVVIGAILLIIPGFFTDILGILLQFGVLSKFIAKKIFRLKNRPTMEDEDVIDVEIIER
ncbi:MAG: exclusion protein FxsA [Epsilonproteobacteria bacterium]|nr:exclusion protein FxsA [Campylobacterota bacterium]NPA63488.1 FxsA family protein [Campylobacterota bacterium]